MEQPVIWNQIDHDALIEVRTSLNILIAEFKTFNSIITANLNALDVRVRTLENTNNRTQGGWRTLVIIVGGIAGLAGLIISYLNWISTVHK